VAYTCRDEAVRERDRRRERWIHPFRAHEPLARVGARVVRSGMELQVVINEAESSLLPIGEATPGIPAEF